MLSRLDLQTEPSGRVRAEAALALGKTASELFHTARGAEKGLGERITSLLNKTYHEDPSSEVVKRAGWSYKSFTGIDLATTDTCLLD